MTFNSLSPKINLQTHNTRTYTNWSTLMRPTHSIEAFRYWTHSYTTHVQWSLNRLSSILSFLTNLICTLLGEKVKCTTFKGFFSLSISPSDSVFLSKMVPSRTLVYIVKYLHFTLCNFFVICIYVILHYITIMFYTYYVPCYFCLCIFTFSASHLHLRSWGMSIGYRPWLMNHSQSQCSCVNDSVY